MLNRIELRQYGKKTQLCLPYPRYKMSISEPLISIYNTTTTLNPLLLLRYYNIYPTPIVTVLQDLPHYNIYPIPIITQLQPLPHSYCYAYATATFTPLLLTQ